MKTAFLYPGQGSQYIKMGQSIYHKTDFAKKIFNNANEILGYDLKKICFLNDQNKINQTKFTQPAIFVYSYILDFILKDNGIKPDAVAGHSLGEITALVSSKCITFENALNFINKRALIMHKIGNESPGKMAAVLNVEKNILQDLINKQNKTLVIANYNSQKQLIISGEANAIDDFIVLVKGMGIKNIIKLNVSGAFHSPLMKKARFYLEKLIKSIEFNDINIPIYQNVFPNKNFDKETIKNNLINQVDKPVQWHQTITNLYKDGIENFIEVGPKNVLTKLNKNILPSINVNNIESMNEYLKYVN